MATSVFLFTVSVVPATILLVFAMKYLSAAVQARARTADNAAYRRLAEAAAAAQAETQASLSVVQAELFKLTASVATVEKILKQVE